MLDFTFFPGWVHKKGGVKVIIDSVHVISDAASPVSRQSLYLVVTTLYNCLQQPFPMIPFCGSESSCSGRVS